MAEKMELVRFWKSYEISDKKNISDSNHNEITKWKTKVGPTYISLPFSTFYKLTSSSDGGSYEGGSLHAITRLVWEIFGSISSVYATGYEDFIEIASVIQ